MGIVEPWLEPMSTKDSIQMRSFMKMFERVSQPKDDSMYSYVDNVEVNYVKKTDAERAAVQVGIN